MTHKKLILCFLPATLILDVVKTKQKTGNFALRRTNPANKTGRMKSKV